jgi:threonine synthase
VKGAFMDVPFRDTVKLGAVNSINWARVLAQMTYYFYAYYQV